MIFVYDICQDNDGKRRLPKIFKIGKKYLHHIQNSVFEGEISKVQLESMKKELKPYIDKDTDSVIFFKSREKRWLDKEFLGKDEDMTDLFL